MGLPRRRLFKSLLIFLYFPVSFSLIGLLAYQMRCPSPITGSYSFKDVFFHYANPFNRDFVSIHLPTMILSLMILFLMATLFETSKPIVTLIHVRIVLLVLMIVVTIFVQVLWLIQPSDSGKYVFMPLFLYADVDLVFLYFLTYLPAFRKLKFTQVKNKPLQSELGLGPNLFS